jgi:hypothetical protein
MNQYFSKVTADHWCPKNKLQEKAQEVARHFERKIIPENQVSLFVSDLHLNIADLNAKYRRCNSLKIEESKAYTEADRDRCLVIPGVFHLTLYLVKD